MKKLSRFAGNTRSKQSRELDSLLESFRDVNESNNSKLKEVKNLADMVKIKIDQPPLLDISKKKVKRTTNRHPWSYSGYAPPSHTLTFKPEKNPPA